MRELNSTLSIMSKVPANIMPNNYIYFRPFIPAFIIHQLRKLNTGDCIIIIEFLLGVQKWCSTANNEQVLDSNSQIILRWAIIRGTD